MITIKQFLGCLSARADQAVNMSARAGQSVNDNDRANAVRQCAAARDPYMLDARAAKQLAASARLVSSVDGNPAALLNVMSTRPRRAA